MFCVAWPCLKGWKKEARSRTKKKKREMKKIFGKKNKRVTCAEAESRKKCDWASVRREKKMILLCRTTSLVNAAVVCQRTERRRRRRKNCRRRPPTRKSYGKTSRHPPILLHVLFSSFSSEGLGGNITSLPWQVIRTDNTSHQLFSVSSMFVRSSYHHRREKRKKIQTI